MALPLLLWYNIIIMKASNNSKVVEKRRMSVGNKAIIAMFVVMGAMFLFVGAGSVVGLHGIRTNNDADKYCNTMENGSDTRKICVADQIEHDQIYYNVMLNQGLICLLSITILAVMVMQAAGRRQ